MKLNLPPKVGEITTKLQKANHEVCIVGGAVRDILMGNQVKDWDFATSATPAEILAIFPQAFYDNRFGTVKLLEAGQLYEITTYRSEKGYSDSRHPNQVLWSKSIEEDLSRRDFTINAMALPAEGLPSTDYRKYLIDPFGGQNDLKARIVKAVGNPNERFAEDALRMLRAVRIAAQLKFIIDEDTFLAIKNNSSLIAQISGERIRDELFKMLATEKPADAFWVLRNAQVLQEVLPEIERCFGVEQKSVGRHHIYDVGTHCFKSLEFCPSRDPLVRFATLIHDIGKPEVAGRGPKGEITFYNHEVVGAHITRNIADRLHLTKKERDKFVTLVRWHQFTVDEATTPAAVRRFIRRVGVENVTDMLDLRVGDRLGGGLKEATSWRLRRFMKMINQELHPPFSVTDLEISGHDVMKILGIGPGPNIGKILSQLFEEVVENKKNNNREYLLKRLEQIKQSIKTK